MAVTSIRGAQKVLRALSSFALLIGLAAALPAAAQSSVTNTVTVTNPSGVTCTAGGSCEVSATDSDTVVTPQLNLAKSHSGNFRQGQNGVYTLTPSNTGTAPTSGAISVVDTLPSGLTYVSATGAGWACSSTAPTVTCTSTDAIANGASGNPITLTVAVASGTTGSVTNTARVSGGGDATCPASGATQSRCTPSDATAIDPPIDAVNDPFGTVVSGTSTASVLGNDTFNGAAATTATVALTPGTAPSPAAGSITMNADGTITVASGTTPGSYSYPYTICQTGQSNNCDTATATLTVAAPSIDAVNDTASTPATTPVTTAVLSNDTHVGGTINPGSVTVTTPSPNGSTTVNATTGAITFTPNAGFSGTTTYQYQVCLASPNQAVCDIATVTVNVGSAIDAVDDNFSAVPINGGSGGSTATVIGNDTANGAAASLGASGSTVLTPGASPSAGLSMNAANGVISVAAGTPAGTYAYPYTLCLAAPNGSTCDTATATLVVVAPSVDAIDDTASTAAITPVTTSVLSNDTHVGGTINPGTVSVTTPSLNGSTAVNTTTGAITFTPNPGFTGTTTYQYRVCLASPNQAVCDTATVTVNVGSAIDAVDDATETLTSAGGTPPTPVTSNDTVNGASAVLGTGGNASITGSTLSSTPTSGGIMLDPATGRITVAPGTTPGTYTLTYTLCTNPATTPATCDTAVKVIVVQAGIDAVDDASQTLTSAGGTTTTPVTSNDTVNNAPAVLGGNATITGSTLSSTPAAGGITLDPATGRVTVAQGTTPGSYTLTYTLCINPPTTPATCDTAVKVIVVQASIDAVDDATEPLTSAGGTTATSVSSNDTVNAVPAVLGTGGNATITGSTLSSTPAAGGITLNPATGRVTVAPGTTPGRYTLTYTLCTNPATTPATCDTAVKVIVVQAGIDAVDDAAETLTSAGGTTATPVTSNDTVNNAPAVLGTGGNATITGSTLSGTPAAGGITLDPATGRVTVAQGTTPGSYTLTYTLCINPPTTPATCDTATKVIVVQAAVDAVDDTMPAIGSGSGGTTPSVLVNDTLAGQPVSLNTVTLTPGASPQAGLTMNADGTITVAPGTPAATYAYPYTICAKNNANNCDSAVATVVVAPPIVANDDRFPAINEAGTTTTVLSNDTLGGQPVSTSTVSLTPGTSPNAGIAMNADGTITVSRGTPAGSYGYPYTICERAHPTNCDPAVATVVVTVTPIVPVDDHPPTVDSSAGATLPSVLGNDTVGGSGATMTNVVLTPGTSPQPGLVMRADGTITVAAGTPAATYAYPYTICEAANPSNCGSAIATVIVASSYDVRLTKTVAVTTAVVGDLVRYTLTVRNVGDGNFVGGAITDTPPPGFTYVAGSLVAGDDDRSATVSGQSPIRIAGVDVAAGQSATFVYLMRVGAGVRQGTQVNQAQAVTAAGAPVSNVATASLTISSDPLVDESLLVGTVFDDRDGDGWQDSAAITGLRVQGGFDPSAYVPNSTLMDAGQGWQPQADASAPLLHGIAVGKLSARQSEADPAEAHQVVIRQVLSAPRFSDDFVLTTDQGVTVRMDAAGRTRVDTSGQAAKGLTAAAPTVERRLSQGEQGYVVDYVIRNSGIDERGIPGVRIASVEGLVMETDQFGRYHLEGVDGGQWSRGRNFILKVDPTTLPSGAQFTTANPLVRRITPGMPVRFDFGVKLPQGLIEGGARTVELELGQVLFEADSAQLKPQYLPVVEKMAGRIEAYHGGEVVIAADGESAALAFDRANAVKAALVPRLTAATAAATRVSLRSEASDPDTMIAGLDGRGPLLGSVLFDTGKATIKPQADALLDGVARYLEQRGGGVVALVGHADRRGDAARNVELGLRRAKAVYQALAQRLRPEVRAKVTVQSSDDPTAPAGVAGQ
ncbi:Ig-like domain-containing protein [Pseudoxanthomonas winnipegensis]|uniref:Ig-like domain-containing protein n=1 Tax=Pseudoxanthomonas winnipegensis TaxID=2480810 RepID=UPI0013EE4C0C|nr:OmpA family protein [Pseudoxanthomonas winnipegensis]